LAKTIDQLFFQFKIIIYKDLNLTSCSDWWRSPPVGGDTTPQSNWPKSRGRQGPIINKISKQIKKWHGNK
jgi:hypothetical protein